MLFEYRITLIDYQEACQDIFFSPSVLSKSQY